MTLKQFNKKLEKDFESLENEGHKDYHYFITHAYRFAHYNEIQDFFYQMDEEEYDEVWKDKVSKSDLSGNTLERIYNQWLNYNHPEYYNFFCYEGLTDILEYFFQTHRKEVAING